MTYTVSCEKTIFDVLFHVGLRKYDYPHVIFSKGSSPRPYPCENFKWYVGMCVSMNQIKKRYVLQNAQARCRNKKGVDSKLKAYSYGTFYAFPFASMIKNSLHFMKRNF